MTAKEFFDWKKSSVTQHVFSQLLGRIEDLKNELVANAITGNPTVLAHKAGAIQAYQDIVLIEFEESNGN